MKTGVDLARNEVEEIEWMRQNTPTLFPWVNQCGDGSEWLARAGTPYAVPEIYSVTGGPGKNATQMAQAQLAGYDAWIGKSQRFGLSQIQFFRFFQRMRDNHRGLLLSHHNVEYNPKTASGLLSNANVVMLCDTTGLTHWPLVGIGDGGDVPNLHSESLTRFQAYVQQPPPTANCNCAELPPSFLGSILRGLNHNSAGWSGLLLQVLCRCVRRQGHHVVLLGPSALELYCEWRRRREDRHLPSASLQNFPPTLPQTLIDVLKFAELSCCRLSKTSTAG
jgi:hypothetical protein